jgi:hypothetical protein
MVSENRNTELASSGQAKKKKSRDVPVNGMKAQGGVQV